MIMNEEDNNINENRNDILRTKINFFLTNSIKCHLDLKTKTWLNGKFLKQFDGDIYLFDDAVLGEQHVTLAEIREVNTFRDPPNKGGRFNVNNF